MKRILYSAAIILSACFVLSALPVLAQDQNDLELTLDVSANNVIPLPEIFKPNMDLSGRGFHRDSVWPQAMAAKEAIEDWQKGAGFSGLYRIQYNLWGIYQFSKDKEVQAELLANYESVIKNINDAGGRVILSIFSTPAGLGKVLDKTSPPKDVKRFKNIVKGLIRELSCNKKYKIWYEVWTAPDVDDFFLGRTQEYLQLYRSVAEAVKELEAESKINIPVGGPSVSSWFRSIEGNTIASPEDSLLYQLIRFCHSYKLPLDFISWHAYSSDPQLEMQATVYKKSVTTLIRDWLSYFNFDRNLPLVVDEWNFDRDDNRCQERGKSSFVAASYIPGRIMKMHEAGIDNQVYFCLEDFTHNKEGVYRNVGVFEYDSEHAGYKGRPKATYNAFKMLGMLEGSLMPVKLEDDFTGVIATKSKDGLALLIYNYADPDTGMNYISRNITALGSGERGVIVSLIKSQRLQKALSGQADIASLRINGKVKDLVKKALDADLRAKKFASAGRSIKLSVKNLKDSYAYQRFVLDDSCSYNCGLSASVDKEVGPSDLYQETLELKPYSLNLIILKIKPKEPVEKVVAVDVALEQAKNNSSDAEEKR